jgi:predicted MFS family arabinose efflux permease
MNRRTLMVGVLAAMFNFSYFYRTAPAVIAPYLVQDFSLGAERLGLLSSIFFYVFAAAQIPLGPALDFIGPRITLTFLGTVAAMGSLIFALAPSFDLCLFGRGLIGLGMSGMLMGGLTIIANWFPAKSFATLAGGFAAIGVTGALIAAYPLALLAGRFGWRNSFLFFCAVNLAATALVWVTVRDHPPGVASPSVGGIPPKEKFAIRRAFLEVLRTPSFWFISTVNFFMSGSFFAIQSLWAGPVLMDVFAMTPAEAGTVLSFIPIGYIVGCPLIAWFSDRMMIPRKRFTMAFLPFYLIPLLFFCAILSPRTPYLLWPAYLSLGLFAGGGILTIAHMKSLFPRGIVGTALSLQNLFAVAGGAILQHLMGVIIEGFPRVGQAYPLEAYRAAFLLPLVGVTASLVLYSRAKSPPVPQPEENQSINA